MSTRTPILQDRNNYQRDWGNWKSLEELPNAVAQPLSAEKFTLEAGDVACVEGTSRRVYCYAPGTVGGGDAVWLNDEISLRVDTVDRPVQIKGQSAYFLPWGTFVRALSTDMRVELSTAGGPFVPLVFGVDWIFQNRQHGLWPQPSTADVSTGAWLNITVVPGDVVRLTWRTGNINVPAPEPVIVRAQGSQLDPTFTKWRYNATLPNAAILGQRAGLQIELWRFCTHQGHARDARALPGLTQYRSGRRYMPYIRFPIAATSDDLVVQPDDIAFSSSPKFVVMRFCYYDPTTGARSPLSEIQTRWIRNRDEANRSGLAHSRFSVWSTRG